MLSGLSGATGLAGSSTLIAPPPPSASCANGLNNQRIRNDLSGHCKSNLSNLERAKLGACSLDHEDAGEGKPSFNFLSPARSRTVDRALCIPITNVGSVTFQEKLEEEALTKAA